MISMGTSAGLTWLVAECSKFDFGLEYRSGGAHIDVMLTINGLEVGGTLFDRGDGLYLVEFTPPITGDGLLHVTLESQHISGSPFRVQVQHDIGS